MFNFIGIMGMLATAIGVWCAYFSLNNDWYVVSVFGALVTWFYVEVVTPNKK